MRIGPQSIESCSTLPEYTKYLEYDYIKPVFHPRPALGPFAKGKVCWPDTHYLIFPNSNNNICLHPIFSQDSFVLFEHSHYITNRVGFIDIDLINLNSIF